MIALQNHGLSISLHSSPLFAILFVVVLVRTLIITSAQIDAMSIIAYSTAAAKLHRISPRYVSPGINPWPGKLLK